MIGPPGDQLSPLLTLLSAVLACPRCAARLDLNDEAAACAVCETHYGVESGIPLLFCSNEWDEDRQDVTDIVRKFYEKDPFPNYDDVESRDTLQRKAREGVFVRLLDEQIPEGSLCLEAGCGTGQLSNFLGMSHKRTVVGADLCLNSLRLAKGFRDHYRVENAGFLQMNLFRPPFVDESFDLVISNGVLHHTSDPRGGFQSILRKLKPGGVIIVGLYNSLGHLPTLWRRGIFERFGPRLHFLDPRLTKSDKDASRKRSWFRDQYEHPNESSHSYAEVLEWFREDGVDFLMGIPKPDGSPFLKEESLFAAHGTGSRGDQWLVQLKMLVEGGRDSGLFMMIGRKREGDERS